MAIGAVLDLVAFGFAAQSLLAPLGGSTIVFNALLSPCFLKEKLFRTDIYATVIILLGCTLTVAFGDHGSQEFSVDELISYFGRWDVILYFFVVTILALLVSFYIWHLEKPYRAYLEACSDDDQSPKINLEEDEAVRTVIAFDIKTGLNGTEVRMWVSEILQLDGISVKDADMAVEEVFFGIANGDEKPFGKIKMKDANLANALLEGSDALKEIFGKEACFAKGQDAVVQEKLKKPVVGRPVSGPEDKHTDLDADVIAGPQSGFAEAADSMFGWVNNPARGSSEESDEEPERKCTETPSKLDLEAGKGTEASEPIIKLVDFLPEKQRTLHATLYASLAGSVGAQSILFGKCVAEMAKHPSDAFASVAFYLVLICMGLTLFGQLRFLNQGLIHHDALIIVPIYQTFWVMVSIIAGGIYFKEIQSFNALSGIIFSVGVIIALSGVFMLTYYRSRAQSKDITDLEPLPLSTPTTTPRNTEMELEAHSEAAPLLKKVQALEDNLAQEALRADLAEAEAQVMEEAMMKEKQRADHAEAEAKSKQRMINSLLDEVAAAQIKSESDAREKQRKIKQLEEQMKELKRLVPGQEGIDLEDDEEEEEEETSEKEPAVVIL